MEYAAAAFHDKVYVARLEHSSKTASEIRADAASTPGTVEHAARTAEAAEELTRAAAAALAAMLAEHKPAGDTTLERARTLSTAGKWAETYDAGATWQHGDGSALPAALVVAERLRRRRQPV